MVEANGLERIIYNKHVPDRAGQSVPIGQNGLTLYAHWSVESPDVLDSWYTSRTQVIHEGQTKRITFDNNTRFALFRFTPATSGKYVLESSASNKTIDPSADLYSASGSKIGFAEEGINNDTDFRFEKELTAGMTYYYLVTNIGTNGSVAVSLNSKANKPTSASLSPSPEVSQQLNSIQSPAEQITISKKPVLSKAKAAGKKKAVISWKKFKETRKTKAAWKQIKKVEVQYSTDPSFQTGVKSRLIGKKKTKVTLGGLKPNTKYFVRIRYTDGAGNCSAWSSVQQIKTRK